MEKSRSIVWDEDVKVVPAVDVSFAPDIYDFELGDEEDEKVPDWKPGKQEWAVMITLAIVSMMVALDATVLVPALPELALDLEGSATDAFWAGTSYLLACAVFQPFIASLSDIFGRKETLLASIMFFTVGTVLCAPVAKDFTVLYIGRVLQGIGGGGIMTMGQVIYSDIVPLRQRPKYFSIVLGSWALGSVLGPMIGGLFVEHLDWRWCFYINFPFCLFGFIFVPIFVKLSTEKTSLMAKLARVDWLGAFLFIGSMTSFLIGLSWAGIQFDWTSVQVIAPIAVGVTGVSASLVWERYGAREPFLRPSLFYSPSALAAYACAWCQGFLLFCALYYLPFYFISVRFESPSTSGINILPVTCLLLPGSILVSFLTSRTGRFRWAIWIGWIITTAGCGLMLLLDQETSIPVWATILSVFGIGNGMVLTSVNVGIQAISHVEDCGRAASMYAFMRTLGMTIGVAVGGTVFQNVMSAELDARHLPEAIAHNAEAFAVRMATLSPTDPVRVGALAAYVRGFDGVWWAMTATAILGLMASAIIRRHSMDKILESKFTLVGGKGSALRERVDRISSQIDLTAKRASAMVMRPLSAVARPLSSLPRPRSVLTLSRLRNGSSMSVDGVTRTMGADDGAPLSPGAAPSKPHPLRQVSGAAESVHRISFMPKSVRPRSVSTARSVEQAPAVSYYVAPGGRKVPVDISTQDISNPRGASIMTANSALPAPPMPPWPIATSYRAPSVTTEDEKSLMKETVVEP